METSNPRRTGCACGRPLEEHPQPQTLPRDLKYERDITYRAADAMPDPTALIEFAETRAGEDHGYVESHLIRTGVDWLREGCCEIADLRNYLCWWLMTHPGDPKSHDVFTALGYVCFVYDLLIREADDD